MALVHKRLYRTGDLARVDCAEYVRDLARYLHLAYGAQVGPVKLDVKVDDIFLGIDTAVPCGLIINELVSNSFKHAFPSGREGEIFVGLGMKQDGCYSLTVRDNGVGIPAGWDLEDPESLGLRLVSRLVEQIEGVIELDRNGGTTFSIDFADPDSRVGE
jgi:two-component sensor histidine kinase